MKSEAEIRNALMEIEAEIDELKEGMKADRCNKEMAVKFIGELVEKRRALMWVLGF